MKYTSHQIIAIKPVKRFNSMYSFGGSALSLRCKRCRFIQVEMSRARAENVQSALGNTIRRVCPNCASRGRK